MDLKLTIFSFLLCILIMVIPVSAADNNTTETINISLSDMDLSQNTKIIVHGPNGNLVGEYNSTDTITLDQSKDYVFIFKPSEQSWFNDPFKAIELLKLEIPTAVSMLLFVVTAVGGLAFVFRILK
jgi:hypothetical protein